MVMLCETGELKDLRRQGYVGEDKLDGTRGIIEKKNGVVHIQNRRGIDYTRRLPELVDAAQEIAGDFRIDGEIVWINPKTGEIEFTPCQRRCATQDFAKIYYLMNVKKIDLQFFSWSLLEQNGENMENWRYLEQKEVLRKLIPGGCRIRYVQHRFDLEQFFEETKQKDREGIVAKKVGGRYEHDRSYSWLKIKNWRPPEVCEVIGFPPGKHSRAHFFGSLVLRRNGKFRGCVGSGFNDVELRLVKDTLADASRIPRPFDIGNPYTAVKTPLKVEVKYYKITENGVMRFPVFLNVVD